MSGNAVLSSHNLYDVLGIAPNADADEVRRAFRSLARLVHPDVNRAQDAARHFAQIAHAHAVLSDPIRRRDYDASRRAPAGTRVRSPHDHGHGGRGPGRGVLRGADVEVTVNLSMREAAFGAEIPVEVTRREVCAMCVGSGTAEGGTSIRCPKCMGTGNTRTGGEECGRCQGSGVLSTPPCPNCLGSGRRRGLTNLIVAVPPAVDHGTVLTLKGDGDAGPRNGPRGDLRLRVEVEPDQVLRRSGIDILMMLPLSPHDAEAGCSIEVPTLRGPKRLRVPPRTADRTLLRISGAGIRPHGSWHRGDQFVTVRIVAGQPIEEPDLVAPATGDVEA
jgi:molecular chaperone DnaJ